jgi:hypothetical protein
MNMYFLIHLYILHPYLQAEGAKFGQPESVLTTQQKRYSAKKIDKHHQKDKSGRKFSGPSGQEG